MKKFIVAVSIVCFVGSNLFAAKNSITTNILGIALGAFNGIYEFEVGDKAGMGIGGSFWGLSSGGWKLSSTAFGVDYNIYLGEKILEGFYVGPSLWLNMISAEYKYRTLSDTLEWFERTGKANGTFITLGGNLGYKWLWDTGFTVGLGLGVGYTFGEIKVADEKAPYGGIGLTRFAVDIGYAW